MLIQRELRLQKYLDGIAASIHVHMLALEVCRRFDHKSAVQSMDQTWDLPVVKIILNNWNYLKIKVLYL
jgi:hypothetical protein